MLRLLPVVIACALAITACTGSEDPTAEATSTTSTTVTSTSNPPPPPIILDVATELDLQAGQCWAELPTPQPPTSVPQARTVSVVDCAGTNLGLVYGNGCLASEPSTGPNPVRAIDCPGRPEDPWPEPRDLESAVALACLPLFEAGVGERYATSDLEAIELVPTEEMWLAGERRYVCTAQIPVQSE
ncbi:MAG: hypothetical protein ACN4GZ_19480 [Acidimicrobiales bacterium]